MHGVVRIASGPLMHHVNLVEDKTLNELHDSPDRRVELWVYKRERWRVTLEVDNRVARHLEVS